MPRSRKSKMQRRQELQEASARVRHYNTLCEQGFVCVEEDNCVPAIIQQVRSKATMGEYGDPLTFPIEIIYSLMESECNADPLVISVLGQVRFVPGRSDISNQ